LAVVWGDPLPVVDEAVARLLDQSLLKGAGQQGERYRLHDLHDEYALWLLRQQGEEDATRAAFAQFLVQLFAKHKTDDPSTAPWVRDELDNLQAAAHWAKAANQPALLAQLATQPRNWLYNVFRINDEWLDWLQTALNGGLDDKQLRANTLKAIGDLQQFRDDRNAALTRYEQALKLFREIGDKLGEANTLKAIGDLQQFRDDRNAALTSYEQALKLFRDIGDKLGEANTLKAIGDLQQFRDDRNAALTSYEQALKLFRDIGAKLGEANTLKAIGDLQQFRKDSNAALTRYEQALKLFRDIGDKLGEANTLKAIGDLQQFRKDSNAALTSYEQALKLFRDIGDKLGEANTLLAMGRMGGDVAQVEEAIGLYEAIGARYSLGRGRYFLAVLLQQGQDVPIAHVNELLNQAEADWASMAFEPGLQAIAELRQQMGSG
jgi:tetratricopeptide (TPR) repeat protein